MENMDEGSAETDPQPPTYEQVMTGQVDYPTPADHWEMNPDHPWNWLSLSQFTTGLSNSRQIEWEPAILTI